MLSQVAYQALNFKRSDYNLGKPIENLIKLIKTKGPLLFSDHLGSDYYKQQSNLLTQKEIKNPVYYWK